MKKELPFIQALKNTKPIELVYPGVLILFFGLVAVVFFFTIRFISQNINKAFSPEESGASQALNIERYKLTAQKLNLPMNILQNEAAAPEPSTEATALNTASATQATSTPVATILDKHAITITIKNSTSKKGIASTLAKALEDAGFTKPQTGNEQTLYATTTILLKESKNGYGVLLLETIQKTYPDAVVATSEENSSSDATIVIGTR